MAPKHCSRDWILSWFLVGVAVSSVWSTVELCNRLKKSTEETVAIGPYGSASPAERIVIFGASGKGLLFDVSFKGDWLVLKFNEQLTVEKKADLSVSGLSSRIEDRHFVIVKSGRTYLGTVQRNATSDNTQAKVKITALGSSLSSGTESALDITLQSRAHLIISARESVLAMKANCNAGTILCRAGTLTIDNEGKTVLEWDREKCIKMCARNKPDFSGDLGDLPRTALLMAEGRILLYVFKGGAIWHFKVNGDEVVPVRQTEMKKLIVCEVKSKWKVPWTKLATGGGVLGAIAVIGGWMVYNRRYREDEDEEDDKEKMEIEKKEGKGKGRSSVGAKSKASSTPGSAAQSSEAASSAVKSKRKKKLVKRNRASSSGKASLKQKKKTSAKTSAFKIKLHVKRKTIQSTKSSVITSDGSSDSMAKIKGSSGASEEEVKPPMKQQRRKPARLAERLKSETSTSPEPPTTTTVASKIPKATNNSAVSLGKSLFAESKVNCPPPPLLPLPPTPSVTPLSAFAFPVPPQPNTTPVSSLNPSAFSTAPFNAPTASSAFGATLLPPMRLPAVSRAISRAQQGPSVMNRSKMLPSYDLVPPRDEGQRTAVNTSASAESAIHSSDFQSAVPGE